MGVILGNSRLLRATGIALGMLLALVAVLMEAYNSPPAVAGVSSSITVRSIGLPPSQSMSLHLKGPGVSVSISSVSASLTSLRPGRYIAIVRPVIIRRAAGHVASGATAYPERRRVELDLAAGHSGQLIATYGSIVNPHVRPLTGRVAEVVGNPANPSAVVLASSEKPAVGTIFASGPLGRLPAGLVSRVTRVSGRSGAFKVFLTAVPITAAVPEITFAGSLPLRLPVPGTGVNPTASTANNACSEPSLLALHAKLDAVELRQASLGLLPPELRLSLAVRTTESLGVAAVAIGIKCGWTLAELGPFRAVLPVGPIDVPVFATVPIKAGMDIEGRLNAGTFNVASTTVATIAAGVQENAANLEEQGTNVWLEGAPSLTGTAALSASIGVQAGIGISGGKPSATHPTSTANNVHLEADFGAELAWKSTSGCALRFDLGKLTAGVAILGHEFSTPPFGGHTITAWSGCVPSPVQPSPPEPQPKVEPPSSSGPKPELPEPEVPPAPPNRQEITSYNRVAPGAPYHGYFDVAWQPFTAASDTITELGLTVGNRSLPAGVAVPYNVTVRLCSAQPASNGACPGQLVEANPQIVNYGATLTDVGDIAVTPGATYWIEWLQPPPTNGETWVTYWWAGGEQITASEELQALVRGYNR